jgi:histone H1/5
MPLVQVLPFSDVSAYHVLWSDAVIIEASAIGHSLAPVAETEAAPKAKKAGAKAKAPKAPKAEKKAAAKKPAAKAKAPKAKAAKKPAAKKAAKTKAAGKPKKKKGN